MSPRAPVNTPLHDLAFELKLAIARDVAFNQDFETFIARLPADTDAGSLKVSLEYCRASTARLSELYALVAALSHVEPQVRALAAHAEDSSMAAMPPHHEEKGNGIRQD